MSSDPPARSVRAMGRGRRAAPPAAALALAFALAGCATLTAPAPPAAAPSVPDAWTAPAVTGRADDLAGWWLRLGDAALPGLVDEALRAGTDVEAAQARLRQARAARELAQAGLAPSVGGSASAQRSDSERAGASNSFRAGLDANWEIDLWGAGRAGVRAAEAGEAASALALAQVRVATAAEVALALLQLRGTQAREAIARRNLASQQQTLQITQWRAEAGLVTTLDVEQARTAVEQTRAQLPALAASAQQTMNALAVLTGRAPGALHAALVAPADGARPPVPPADLTLAIPADVLRQRPDVQAAERQLAAAAARVEQADAQRLPSLSIGGSVGLAASTLGGLAPGAGVASLLAGVSVPLLDFGRLQAQVRQQEAARDEAAANWRASVLAALQEVEDALVSLAGTRAQLVAQQAAAASARNAARLADQRYRSGLVDFQNVLQSQRTLLAAEDAVAGTTTTLATAHVRLYKALGGGWRPQSDTAAAAAGRSASTATEAAVSASTSSTSATASR